jgi:hypothetical protein
MIFSGIEDSSFWAIRACGIFFVSAGIVLLFLLSLAMLSSGTWPEYNLYHTGVPFMRFSV